MPTCTSYAWIILTAPKKDTLLLASLNQNRVTGVLGRLAEELHWLGLATVWVKEEATREH